MAFKVEDGTGLADATSYVDVSFADTYYAMIGFDAWGAYTVDQKEQWLEEGTSYSDLRWGNDLNGRPLVTTQALEFPRKGLKDRYGRPITGVPTPWKKAVCQYAMQATKGALVKQTVNTDGNLIKKKTIVGPITTEKTWEEPTSSASSVYLKFPAAEILVKQYLGSGYGDGNKKVIRN